MENAIIKHLTDWKHSTIDSIVDASTAGMALGNLQALKAVIKETEAEIENKIIEWGKREKVYKADIGGGMSLVFSQTKTTKFDTQEIYKALEVSQELIDILPANPAFRKSAVKQNDKISHLFYEEVKGEVEVKRPKIVETKYLEAK